MSNRMAMVQGLDFDIDGEGADVLEMLEVDCASTRNPVSDQEVAR